MADFMSGAYSVSFAGQDMGRTEVGFEKIMRPSVAVIRADETGRTPVDGILTGVEDIMIRIMGIEWSRNIWNSICKFLSAEATGSVVAAGTLLRAGSQTGSLIITPLTGPAASSNAGGLYTYHNAYPLEPISTVFSAQRLRSASMGFFCFANAVGANSIAVMYNAVYA